MRSTVKATEEKRNEIALQYKAHQAILLDHMGDFSIEQEFIIDHHPLDSKKDVVIGKQLAVEDFDPVQTINPNALSVLVLQEEEQ